MATIPHVLKQEAQEDKGENARLQYFVGAIALGDLIKSTLGPRGMDKILQPMDGTGGPKGKNGTITNDGATILKSVWLDNPAAKILADLSVLQDSACGDGTTGVVVLAAELLRNAEQLVMANIHPQIICSGYRMASEKAIEVLEKTAFSNKNDPAKFREDLMSIARTTLSSKLVTHEKELFANLAVNAVLRLNSEEPNIELIHVIKKPGGSFKDSFLAEGFILEKRIGVGQPKKLQNCKIMVANTPMDTDKIKIFGARVSAQSFETVQAIETAEREKMKAKVEQILKHQCNVFINRQLIYNYPDELFRNAGVMAIEHSDFDGMERLAAALGAEIVSTFHDPSKVKLGTCGSIEEIMIGEDRMIAFNGCERSEACTIVLRGSSSHFLAEAERSLHDAIAVLSQTIIESRVTYGGGCAEMAMAAAVDKMATTVFGKTALAVEAYAKALRQIPTIILDNGGYDSAEIVAKLRAAHANGSTNAGIDIENGEVGDMAELRIMESFKSKVSQVKAASEAAEMIVRVDDIIRCAARQRSGM